MLHPQNPKAVIRPVHGTLDFLNLLLSGEQKNLEPAEPKGALKKRREMGISPPTYCLPAIYRKLVSAMLLTNKISLITYKELDNWRFFN